MLMQSPETEFFPAEHANLKDLVYILQEHLKIINNKESELPKDISIPILNLYLKLKRAMYNNLDEFKYLCERIFQYEKDKRAIDLNIDKKLRSHMLKVINQLEDDEYIEVQIASENADNVLFVEKNPFVKINLPCSHEGSFINFFLETLKSKGYCLGMAAKTEIDKCGFVITGIEEDSEDKLYTLIKSYCGQHNLLFGSHADEKLTFGDLKVNDSFIGFPMAGDNHGHGGYLGGHLIYVKIEPDEHGDNAVRFLGKGTRSKFPDAMKVLKVS